MNGAKYVRGEQRAANIQRVPAGGVTSPGL